MGGKVCLRCKGKILLGIVNQRFTFKSLLTTTSNVLPLHLKQTFPPIIWIFIEGEDDGINSGYLFYFIKSWKVEKLSREIAGNHSNRTFKRFCPQYAVDFTSLKPLCMKFSGWITIQVDIIKIFNIVAICRHHLLDPVWYNKNQQNMCIFDCIARH